MTWRYISKHSPTCPDDVTHPALSKNRTLYERAAPYALTSLSDDLPQNQLSTLSLLSDGDDSGARRNVLLRTGSEYTSGCRRSDLSRIYEHVVVGDTSETTGHKSADEILTSDVRESCQNLMYGVANEFIMTASRHITEHIERERHKICESVYTMIAMCGGVMIRTSISMNRVDLHTTDTELSTVTYWLVLCVIELGLEVGTLGTTLRGAALDTMSQRGSYDTPLYGRLGGELDNAFMGEGDYEYNICFHRAGRFWIDVYELVWILDERTDYTHVVQWICLGEWGGEMRESLPRFGYAHFICQMCDETLVVCEQVRDREDLFFYSELRVDSRHSSKKRYGTRREQRSDTGDTVYRVGVDGTL
ncbi:hypothetical protein Tco_1576987 [Tanacetum coccineum]